LSVAWIGPHGGQEAPLAYTEVDEKQLVRAYQAGDERAFDTIVRTQWKALFSHALRRLNDPESAEDAVQDTLLRAYRALPSFSGDLAIITDYTAGFASALRIYDVTNPATACLIGSKLLTVSPGSNHTRADGAVRSADAIPRTITAIQSAGRWKTYTAVENLGLMMADLGFNIPSTSNTNLAPEPFAGGNYVDVVASNNRLIAINRDGPSLDVFDASLARVSSTPIPQLSSIRGLAYAEAVPIDLPPFDGQIGQNEVRNLAFVGGTGGVAIVDVTDLSTPSVVGVVPIDANIFYLDVDPEKRRVFAGGESPRSGGEYRVFILDLSGQDPFSNIDRNADNVDDRIVWQSPAGTYAGGTMWHRAIRFIVSHAPRKAPYREIAS